MGFTEIMRGYFAAGETGACQKRPAVTAGTDLVRNDFPGCWPTGPGVIRPNFRIAGKLRN